MIVFAVCSSSLTVSLVVGYSNSGTSGNGASNGLGPNGGNGRMMNRGTARAAA